MADKKISALTGATTPLDGTEVLPIVQSGATVKVAVSDLTAARAVATAALSASGIILTTDATDASSTTAASMKTAGGLAVVKKTYIGDNIVQGTAAKGINYTANTPAAGMTSQLLNWYEEGTWTPAYDAYAGAFTTLTYTTQQGTYTRVGRTVICQFNIVVNLAVVGTAATLLLLKGFPFPINNGALAAAQANGYINFFTGWTTNAPTLINHAGFTDKLGLLYSSATTISNTPPANVTAACQLRGTVIYQI